jgi:hypothetical protein
MNKIIENPLFSNEHSQKNNKMNIHLLYKTNKITPITQIIIDISRENWEELHQEELDDRDFAEENGMDSIYWCNACKLGICEIITHY